MAIMFSNSEFIGDSWEPNFIRIMGVKATWIRVEEISVNSSFNIFQSRGEESMVA